MLWFAYLIFAAFVLIILLVSWGFVKYYNDRHEAEALPTLVSTLGLAIVLFTTFLVPVDIYVVSSSVDTKTGLPILPESDINERTKVVAVLYYVLYGLFLLFASLVIPFTYFYFEEKDLETRTKHRVWAGFKYTIFLVLIVLILFIAGFFITGSQPNDGTQLNKYIRDLLKSENAIERAISFCMAALALLGYLCWLIYSAYGLSSLPMSLLKGRRDVDEEIMEVKDELAVTREKKRAVASKYIGGGRQVTNAERDRMALLSDKERALSRTEEKLTGVASSCWLTVSTALKPFSIVFGILFFLCSLFVVVVLLLVQIDRIMHSYCSARCGFLYNSKWGSLFNPLDNLLVFLARFFPLDFIVFTLFVLYMFFTTLSGVVHIGVRFLWVKMFRFEHGRTLPQGLLLATVLLMFALLALNFELSAMAPQYVNFGTQTYLNANGTVMPCSPGSSSFNDSLAPTCTMTQIGTFVTRISYKLSFFGSVFYWVGWVFVGTWLIGLIIAIWRRKAGNYEEDSDSELMD